MTAATLAGHVLAVDRGNLDAEDLLTAPGRGGEIRRLTILFADIVDSTALSTHVEPETYRILVGRYRDLVLGVVDRYEGHVASTKGDGLMAVFGYPKAHENDVRRGVLAALEISREVARLGEQAQRRFGVSIAVRVGVHRGVVYLDTAQDDLYGTAANLAQRVSGLAPAGSVVVSDAVASLVGEAFELQARPPAAVKGFDTLISYHLALDERADVARVGVGQGPLVGRDRELVRLQKSWRRARAGTLRTPGLVFRGEPGIGKSRLMAAAVELVEGSAGVVLLIGSPFHTDVGLHPVRTLLERRCGITRLTDPAERLRRLEAEVTARSLNPARVVPLLAPVLEIADQAGYRPVAAEGRKLYELIAAGVQEYLLACVGRDAALVAGKDVQWFDPSTVEVLGGLLEAARGRLLVVITGQDGAWLPAGWPVEVFDLKPLTDEQADKLITALNPRLSAEDRAVVRAPCDGIPFYVEQLVRAPGDRHDGGAEPRRVPDALYELLFARLRASANVVPVLEAAAVIGRQFDRGLLSSVVDLSDDEIDDVLDKLEHALVLEPSGVNSWRFRHELLHEVARELAPASVGRRLHGKVADALVHGAGDADPDWRLVAGHYEHAARFDDAVFARRHASTIARRRGALTEARTHLTQALADLDRAPGGTDRDRREIAVRLERGFLAAAVEGNQTRAAVGDFERCLKLAGAEVGDELVATMVALTVYYFTRADLRRVVRILRSLRTGPEHERQWLRPATEASFGVVAWLRGEFNAAYANLQHSMPGLTATADQLDVLWYQPNDPVTTARLHMALTLFVRGDLRAAEEELAHIDRRVRKLGFPQGAFSASFALFLEVWMRIEAGQLHRAAALAADLVDQAERHGFGAWHLWGGAQQATVSALTTLGGEGDDPDAIRDHIATMSGFVDVLHRAGLNAYLTFFEGVLGRLLTSAGEPKEARSRLDNALLLAHDTGMHFYDAELLRLRAHTQTDGDAHYADLAAARDLSHRQGATLFGLRSALDDFELRGEPARPGLVEAAGRFPSGNLFPELARAQLFQA